MAEFSIDQNKLPGVKEVVRDFAVLEDHCLAHNLQEQEIESHLASNVHKSRLVQQDVALAKQLQEEEDRRAKAKAHRQHRDIERSDNEIAQEIQEELVRQAKQQRMQEEKDAAIARKLQEKERKEERKRQKQLEANFEEEYYEDNGTAILPPLNPASQASLHLDDKPRWPGSNSLSLETRTNSLSRYPEHHLEGREGRRGRHGDRYPDYHHPTEGRSRGKEGQRSRDHQGSQSTFFADNHEPRRQRDEGDRVVRRKERPARPPPPSHIPVKRDEASSRARHREWERDGERDGQREPRRDEEIERDSQRQERHGERLRDQEHSRDKDRHRERTKSRERGLDEVQDEPTPSCRSRAWDSGGEESPSPGDDEEGKGGARARLMLLSGPSELCEEAARRSPRMGRGERGHRDPGEGPSTGKECSHTHPAPREPGHIVQGGPGGRGAGNYGLGEVTQGITKLDLREQELLDMEVARKLQEEEVKASKMDKRAAQVAQDEEIATLYWCCQEIATLYWCCQEIARLLMEREKMEYKKSREKEKQGVRPEERRRPEGGNYKPSSEEVVHPRLREEEYQKPRNHQKPARPSQPPPHNYENVESSYSGSHYSSGSPARPEASYKGVYYRQ
uniref:zinc finger CCCH domain-containing protein 13-like isoform X4 n=1 Tax=Oncorhynchus gorbuscha TaxID=8017 RepID=UPI001EAEDB8B|nr:zinc finger CCCH domain-containing protein 13-like isoform X4 [Oncorhynchus gorbuscha]